MRRGVGIESEMGREFAQHPVGADAHIGPLRNSEFAADFRKKRCGLRADRVVRPYRVRGIENFFAGADDSVGLLRSYEFV